MTEDAPDDDKTCPTCGRDDFKNWNGVQKHHAYTHGDSIAKIPIECEHCGTTVEKYPSQAALHDRDFCSRACAAAARRERITVPCATCGGPVETHPYKRARHDRLFCSRFCQQLGYRGAANPRWKNGASLAHAVRNGLCGSERWDTLAARLRPALPTACARCGRAEADLPRKLDIHHIVPVVAGGANFMANYMMLCPGCHRTVENWGDVHLPQPIYDLINAE